MLLLMKCQLYHHVVLQTLISNRLFCNKYHYQVYMIYYHQHISFLNSCNRLPKDQGVYIRQCSLGGLHLCRDLGRPRSTCVNPGFAIVSKNFLTIKLLVVQDVSVHPILLISAIAPCFCQAHDVPTEYQSKCMWNQEGK